MIANSPYRSVRVWLVPGLLMLLLLLTELLGDWGRTLLAYDRRLILDGQWWRLLSGNFVHLGWYHLMLNELGLAVLVLLCPEPLSVGAWLRRILFLSVFMSSCLLLFVPELSRYVGMSGVIHGLFVLGLLPQVRRGDLIASGCLLYLVGKIGWELFAGAPVSDESAIGGHVVTESHLYGVVGAALYAAVLPLFKVPRDREKRSESEKNPE